MTDPKALARELERAVDGEVRFDAGSRAIYSRDASNYRQVPIGVVLPRHKEDIVATVRLCREADVPVLPRGGGTSLAGQCTNTAVVMDTTKHMREVLEVDPAAKRARVLPGAVLDDLRSEANRHGLTFGPDPATHDHCALGGMLGNNSCGPHSILAGKTVDNVVELEVLTYDGARFRVGPTPEEELERVVVAGGRRGEIYGALREIRDRHADEIRARYPDIPRRVSGYNLDDLLPERGFDVAKALVGTEGTCVTYLEATLRLVDWPAGRALLVLGYPDVYAAADHVPRILEQGPIALEGLDRELIRYMRVKGLREENLRLLPEGGGWLLVEFGGATRAEADEKARKALDRLRGESDAPTSRLYDDPADEATVWQIRESGLGATARVPGERDTWPGWEDSAVAPEKLGGYLRDLRELFEEHGYAASLYGHFGQGCVHTRIPFDLVTAAGLEDYRRFMDEATDLVLSYGGSLSGEHGDGQARGEWLPKMYGDDLVAAFRDFKRAWDPAGRMNPGKVVDPDGMEEHLALGTSYEPRRVETSFRFPDDDGSFHRAVTRCVGVGKCRRLEGGTMCPSYMATRDEMHSTRGRAHALFEMLNGDEIDGWRDDHVEEALDLCLSCKGCRSDCPVNVDMATYKAEFRSHHYARRLRPRAAYAMGLIHWWARAASLAPRLVNAVAHAPGIGRALKWAGGIAPEREIPRFARRTFRRRWRARGGSKVTDGPRVVLFVDTFNDAFFPETLEAGVDVLEAAGFRVEVPDRVLCCGRPLYDFGMLDLARRQLRRVLDGLRPWIRAGVPVVGLEPSCLCTFRDELVAMYPEDPDARRLHDLATTFAELLGRGETAWEPPALEGKALLWGHCHQRSVVGMEPDLALLRETGLEVEHPVTACCGLAGAFGFERGHYDVSMAIGEHDILPRVREADPETRIVADGFSCRQQVLQATGRRPHHLAELLREAIGKEESG